MKLTFSLNRQFKNTFKFTLDFRVRGTRWVPFNYGQFIAKEPKTEIMLHKPVIIRG